ncbi:MAG: ParB family protein [Enterobacteriaceae bacterium]
MTSDRVQALGEQLLQRGRSPSSGTVAVLPVSEMPMVLTLDQLRPNPDNPRTSRNPRYDEIKSSILARGLDSVPKVTKNPDCSDDVYIFSDGGNTRYTILVELWEETREERFRRIQCIFKPWPGRLQCVIGHLAENDVRGDLSFIEKSFGVAKARSIQEEILGRALSQRELADLLNREGYPIHHSSISRMEYVIKQLYPCLPTLLESGLSRGQVVPIINLRMAAERAWDKFSLNTDVVKTFENVFAEVCHSLDDPEHYTLETLKDELIAALLREIPSPEVTYDRWLIELDPKEQNRRKLFGDPEPIPQHVINADHQVVPVDISSEGRQTKSAGRREGQIDLHDQSNQSRVPTLPDDLATDVIQQEPQDNEQPLLPESAISDSSVSFANTGLEPVMDIWRISALQDDIEHLQDAAFRLVFELAEVLEAEQELCEDNTPDSVGYRLQVEVHMASPLTRLLVGLSGDANVSLSAVELTNILIGTAQPVDWPLFDDIQVVKFLRLIRVVRRLREIQRQSQQGGEE